MGSHDKTHGTTTEIFRALAFQKHCDARNHGADTHRTRPSQTNGVGGGVAKCVDVMVWIDGKTPRFPARAHTKVRGFVNL
jgi:hypothetical protein